MLKHPRLSHFHSRAEYLHAGLLEGDPDVISYVPQPFLLRVGARRYTPDCYVVRRGAGREVLELKPGGQMDAALQDPLTAFFARKGMTFRVVSNESVFEQQQLAENWLLIVNVLHQARWVDTDTMETRVLEQVWQLDRCQLGDLVDAGDRDRTYYQEIALLRLLHRGRLTAPLDSAPLEFNTEITLCG